MFALLLIKFNQFNNRTRLLAGLSVAFIILVAGSGAFYLINCYDDLSRFTSKNTSLYLHLDYRSAPDNLYRIKLTEALLAAFGLSSLDRHDIGSELAIICDNYARSSVCGLIIQAKRPDDARKFLTENRLTFRETDRGVFMVARNAAWLGTIKKSRNPLSYLSYQSALGKYGAITVAIKPPTETTNDIAKLLKISGISANLKFSGAINPDNISLKRSGLSNTLSVNQLPGQMPASSSCDIMLKSSQGLAASSLENYIAALFAGSESSGSDSILNDGFQLCLDKIAGSGSILNDYAIDFRSSRPLSAGSTQKLESILLNSAAKQQPTEKTYYLKDGTKISELWPKPNNFSFGSTTLSHTLQLDNNTLISYSNNQDGLKITVNIDQNKINIDQLPDNSAFVRVSALPDGAAKNLLDGFSYLSLSANELLIK